MFGALRDKLKGAIKKFTKDAEEASDVVHVKEDIKAEVKAKDSNIQEKPKTEAKAEKSDAVPISNPAVAAQEEHREHEKEDKKAEKKGFFGKLKSIFSKEETHKPAETLDAAEFPAEKPEQNIKKGTEEKKKNVEEKEVKQKAHERVVSDIEKAEEEAKEEIEEAIKETRKGIKEDVDKDKKIEHKEKTPEDEFLEEFIEDYEDKSTIGVDLEEEKDEEVAEKKETKKDVPAPVALKPAKEAVKEQKPVKLKKEEIKEITEKTEDIQIEEPVSEIKPDTKSSDVSGTKEYIKQQPKTHETEEPKEEKRSFFSRITDLVTKTSLNEKKFDELFWELELSLLENNVAVEVIEKIKLDLKSKLVGQPITRGKLEEVVIETLIQSISGLFDVEKIDMIKLTEEKKKVGEPLVIAFVGVNGSGKTTTIAKIAKMFLNNKMRPIIAAADTFRAAAIQQLEVHSFKLGVKLIKHDYGADPAAVAFDAVKYAKQKGYDVVLIDTAGRLHSNTNLMDEMKKIIRVAKPDLKLFIGESITGNDCVEQAREFNEAIGIDGIILCKADVDDKGGAAISVSFITGKPIIYVGTGQGYDDLKEFDKSLVMNGLELKEGEYS